MITKEFEYSDDAHYPHSSTFKSKQIDIINQNIAITSDNKNFKTSFPNLFEKYKLPYVKSDAIVQRWNSNLMSFWQNQLNFAIWCATTGCGVDYNHHLKADAMIGSLFKFHVYYQARRILFEMGVALPQDSSWNAFNNSYDRSAYERICKEFNVDQNADWRQKQSYNNGLGTIYNYWTNNGYHPLVPIDTQYNNKEMSFTQGLLHIDYIAQGSEATWTTLIIDNAVGFTKAGVERINDSIRTFCWAILSAQSQTRTDIIGTGTAFDAQKQFLANLEDAINSPVDLPSQIKRYQDTLKYARSKVDFVFGIGLYMCPSDMELQIGTIVDYNNEIVIARETQELGLNNGVNTKPIPPKQNISLKGTPTKQTQEEPEYYQKYKDYAKQHGLPNTWVDMCIQKPGYFEQWVNPKNNLAQGESKMKVQQLIKLEETAHNNQHSTSVAITQEQKKDAIQHEDNKTALIVGSIVIGITSLIIYKNI